MGLLDLTTDLKSLRYGQDRLGGGSSNEPFITQPIDSTPGEGAGPDFLLRANSLQRVADDTTRMFKYLKSPKGLQFIAKQNLLSRSAVKSQASNGPLNDGVYLPTSTLAQIAVNAGGGHLLKQGINPFANTTTDASNTGIGVLDDVLNFLSDDLPLSTPFYAKKIGAISEVKNNRLTQLVNYKLGISQGNSSQSFLDQLISGGSGGGGIGGFLGGLGGGILNNILSTSPSAGQKYNSISLNQGEILRYDGGPGSALGVGQTSLKRVTDTNNIEPFLYNYSELVSAGDSKTSKDQILPDFRAIKDPSSPNSVISTTLNYQSGQKGHFEERINIGNPGRRNKNLSNYNIGTGTGALDKINALPLYSSTNVISTGNNIKNDFVKFRIGILDNKQDNGTKTYIHFRAFIDSFADNYTAAWSEEKFMGRAENFYRYGGFNRSISMGWTCAAQSVEELIPMYQKLNYLASSLAPDYSDEGYMQGNIAYLTFGGYCFEQPGIITSLNLSYPQESPWEIDVDSKTGANDGGVITKELPMIMTVSGFEFKPIHNFVPRIQQNSFDGLKEGTSTFVSAWGKERYIALENAKGNNYTGINNSNFTKDSTFTVPSSTTDQERGSLFGPTGSNSFSSQATGLNN